MMTEVFNALIQFLRIEKKEERKNNLGNTSGRKTIIIQTIVNKFLPCRGINKLKMISSKKNVAEQEISIRSLNVLLLLSRLGAEEVNGCLHGPLNQMAITILHTNTRLWVFFSALVIEPQGNFHQGFFTKGFETNLPGQSENFNKRNQLTRHNNLSEPPNPSSPLPTLPRSHYIVNLRLIHNGQKHFTLQMKVPFPTILCLPLGLLTPR